MSRIGQKPIDIPSGVTVEVKGNVVSVKGKLGELVQDIPGKITVSVEGARVLVARPDDTKASKSFHGLVRSLIANMIEGVMTGYRKELEIQGVGFKAAVSGQKILLSLGFASAKEYMAPEGVKVVEEGGTKVVVSGSNKQKVGEAAAMIRSFFPAEPYKGKGIRYAGERVRRKVGKTVA